MRDRLKLLALIGAAIAVGLLGLQHAAYLTELASAATEKAFEHPPSVIATPPPGARLDAWWHDTLLEAWRDGTLLVLAGVIILAALLHQVSPQEQRRIRTSALCFIVYLLSLPLSGLFVSLDLLPWYGRLRLLALLAEAITITNVAAIFIFDIVLKLVNVRPPTILRDLLIASAYVGAFFTLLSRAGFDLTGLIATSAVITAVIGFSLQDTLGNIMGGIALQWEDTIGVGDWVKVGDLYGKVKEIRWRQTTIETRNWDTAVVPNSVLMKGQVLIVGRRTAQAVQHRQWVYFHVGFQHPPSEVIAAVNEALQAAPIERIALEPKPHCIVYDFHEYAAYYAVRYWLTDLAVDDPTDSVVRTRIHYALARVGISLAIPKRSIHVTRHESAHKAAHTRDEKLEALKRVALFTMLNSSELEKLVPHLKYAPFTTNEVMTRQGAVAHWLYLIIRGQARVDVRRADGEVRFVARLSDGDFFGEMALLTGEPRSATVVAESDVECWRLDREGFQDIVQHRPEIASELSRILAARRVGLKAVHDDKPAAREGLEGAQHELLSKITQFFGL
jgi:small-conductance mechanosensitive channel